MSAIKKVYKFEQNVAPHLHEVYQLLEQNVGKEITPDLLARINVLFTKTSPASISFDPSKKILVNKKEVKESSKKSFRYTLEDIIKSSTDTTILIASGSAKKRGTEDLCEILKNHPELIHNAWINSTDYEKKTKTQEVIYNKYVPNPDQLTQEELTP